MECGVPAVRSGVLAFSGVPHFCISVIVLVVAFHGVPWWSILAWSGDLAFCGVPACRAGLPGVLAFQASLVIQGFAIFTMALLALSDVVGCIIL